MARRRKEHKSHEDKIRIARKTKRNLILSITFLFAINLVLIFRYRKDLFPIGLLITDQKSPDLRVLLF